MARVTIPATTCDRCASPLERDDLRCAICSRAAPAVAPVDHAEVAVEVVRCASCGAATTYAIREQAPVCAFCGSVAHLEQPDDPLEQTQRFLPFTVDRATAKRTFERWLRGLGWFRPSDLVSASRVEALRALWWVGWVFDARALVSWTVDSDQGRRKSAWAPHAGRHEIDFDRVVVSASRGLGAGEVELLLPSYDLGSARPRPEGGGAGAVVERFDVRRSAARSTITATIERLAREALNNGRLPGRRFRNLRTAVLLRRLVTDRYAFPAYVMAYRYRDRLYRFVVSGQDAACLRGQAPYSWLKLALAILGVLLGSVLLLAGIMTVSALVGTLERLF